MWQLARSGELLVWWRPVADPEGAERAMLAEFRAEHGRLSFANLLGEGDAVFWTGERVVELRAEGSGFCHAFRA